ncbi:hypothetical protein ACBY01_16705 [Sphingomonas sp. ac-8]|uniref:hypothetical protein n=1 Tax=Sphingomonas sp. ac-8 TaxID=3242977 RepID=UPI003A7FAC54
MKGWIWGQRPTRSARPEARRKPALPDLPPPVEAAPAGLPELPDLPPIDDSELKLPENRRVPDPNLAMFGGWRFGAIAERAAWRNGRG